MCESLADMTENVDVPAPRLGILVVCSGGVPGKTENDGSIRTIYDPNEVSNCN